MDKKLVLIDVDNTLINIDNSHFLAIEKTLSKYFGISYESIRTDVVMMQRSRAQDLTAEHPSLHIYMGMAKSRKKVTLDTLSDAISFYESLLDDLIEPMPGAKEFLVKCNECNVPVVAVTNNFMHIALKRLDRVGFSSHMKTIFTPECYGISKPNSFFYQVILKDFGLSPRETIMIGDNFVTDGGASNIGIDFELINSVDSRNIFESITKRYFS